MENNLEIKEKKINKKIVLISVIALIVIAAVISTIVIVKNATAKEVKTGNDNTQQVEIQTTRIEVVTDAQGETVTSENGEAVTVIITEPATTKSVVINGTTAKATTTNSPTTLASTNQATSTKKTNATNPVTESDNKVDSTSPTTLAQSNDARISKLKSDFGIYVQRGPSTYTWSNLQEYTGETDEEVVSGWLDVIEKEVKRYPTGFFREINPSRVVNVKLLHGLGGDLTGYASYEIPGDYEMGFDTSRNDAFPSRLFNHEAFHLIEKHITDESKMINQLSGTWTLIPESARNSSGNEYVMNDTSRGYSERYFITAYAKTNERDDRAETFADYMFRPYQKDYMKDPSFPMPRKMKIISQNIRTYFQTAKSAPAGSLPWEKLL